jgi:hypothetical protein
MWFLSVQHQKGKQSNPNCMFGAVDAFFGKVAEENARLCAHLHLCLVQPHLQPAYLLGLFQRGSPNGVLRFLESVAHQYLPMACCNLEVGVGAVDSMVMQPPCDAPASATSAATARGVKRTNNGQVVQQQQSAMHVISPGAHRALTLAKGCMPQVSGCY